MRPPRIAILILFFSATLFLLCRSLVSLVTRHDDPVVVPAKSPPVKQATVASPDPPPFPPASKHPRYGSFFSFSSPLSLFPPNAIITLTDDNGTSFPARPAAFGPAFPNKGLSGQLWIGSGFADDNLQEGEGEGELGCSDLAGWDDNHQNVRINIDSNKRLSGKAKTSTATGKTKNQKRHEDLEGISLEAAAEEVHTAPDQPVNDGTDDYLAAGLKSPSKSAEHPKSNTEPSHADIQSLQEAAEIAGKLVLLSRGGCGFAEKVLWAQRRGAVAVIVGDNQRGGPLIQMYARGDTSNITIPSVFTSRTTAHILSSLMHPGSFLEDTVDENGNSAVKVQKSDPKAASAKGKAKGKNKGKSKAAPEKKSPTPQEKKPKTSRSDTRPSWFKKLFSWGSSSSKSSDVRVPQSGQIDWVRVEDFDDAKDKVIQAKIDDAKGSGSSHSEEHDITDSSEDSFQIGVQDWRDPDLVDPFLPDPDSPTIPNTGSKNDRDSASDDKAESKKDSINTPGSGQYGKKDPADSEGFISRLFGEDDGADFSDGWPEDEDTTLPDMPVTVPNPEGELHEGLWVTITPSSSASPFLDTLLVLVVSPLITLTVVYALLILRARIRRRRWRAPKSVVDRLPVRTYHTLVVSPAVTPRIPSPTSSSPRTPLLQQPASEGPSRPRPRSRTSTGIPDPNDRLRPDSGIPPQSRSASRTREHPEKASGTSQWKKYMGRQVECVVCLEEYVDGVSRVMSLPCGHEFHAECITPWLTTRRRTCPICKGDVVRSLARGTASGPRYEPYRDDSSEDEEDQLIESSDNGQVVDQDLEAGILSEPRERSQGPSPMSTWLNNVFGRARRLGQSRTPSREDGDRDR
ncbi:hypothetical protein MKZ38_006596 [Zalerion maritima]|uniref:RING-type domain-containing protein n=1 Tax=Zalerion maritima TaxID=339359 RepID=A0AAD5WPP7_9PEZI|nr:hypothetical protein MKZ38_006596 [Zalerion maritima]